MSEIDQLLVQVIKGNTKQTKGFVLFVGTVKAVEGDTCTVDDYEDIRLNAIIEETDSQFTVYPKVGSKVVIGRLKNTNSMFVIGVSDIEKLIIKMGNQLFEFKEGNVTISIGDQVFEMKSGKFKITNGDVSLKSILNDGFDQLGKAIIMTPSGPGKFSEADKLVFADLKDKTNQLLS